MFQPTQEFCDQAGLPYPLPMSMYNSNEFTFAALQQTLMTMLEGHTEVLSAGEMKTLTYSGGHTHMGDFRAIGVTIPVCFSPTHAMKIAEVLKQTQIATGKKLRPTFLFGTGLAYANSDPLTIDIMRTLKNQGHAVGLLVTLTPDSTSQSLKEIVQSDVEKVGAVLNNIAAPRYLGFHRIGILKDKTRTLQDEVVRFLSSENVFSLHDNSLRDPGIAICATEGGCYRKGHPTELFTSNKHVAILQLAEAWYSDVPQTPYERLIKLVGTSITHDYQKLLGHPIFGAPGTAEPKMDTSLPIATRADTVIPPRLS